MKKEQKRKEIKERIDWKAIEKDWKELTDGLITMTAPQALKWFKISINKQLESK